MELVADHGKAVPITILTGFLVAGKTTRLNRILNGTHGLQVVGRRVNISWQDEWGERTPRTQIVVIGAVNCVDPENFRQIFDLTVSKTRAELIPANT